MYMVLSTITLKTMLSPTSSLRRSTFTKKDYLYKIEYISNENKVPNTKTLPLLNPDKAFTKPSSLVTKIIKHAFVPEASTVRELILASHLSNLICQSQKQNR